MVLPLIELVLEQVKLTLALLCMYDTEMLHGNSRHQQENTTMMKFHEVAFYSSN